MARRRRGIVAASLRHARRAPPPNRNPPTAAAAAFNVPRLRTTCLMHHVRSTAHRSDRVGPAAHAGDHARRRAFVQRWIPTQRLPLKCEDLPGVWKVTEGWQIWPLTRRFTYGRVGIAWWTVRQAAGITASARWLSHSRRRRRSSRPSALTPLAGFIPNEGCYEPSPRKPA